MSSHKVQVNNFVKVKEKSPVDGVSKIFIIFQWILGINRMGVMTTNTYWNIVFFLYPMLPTGGLLYACFLGEDVLHLTTKLFQFFSVGFICLLTRGRLRRYYNELKTFDTTVGCKLKVTRQALLMLFSMITLNFVTFWLLLVYDHYLYCASLHFIQILENHYYGYLFYLLKQRIHLMNYVLESSLLTHSKYGVLAKMDKEFIIYKNDGKKMHLAMNDLMDLYYIVINAYDILTDAIKWQLLFIITTSFVYTLALSYKLALLILNSVAVTLKWEIILLCVTIASETLPLMAPCVGCDMVRQKVRKLRELLASKLFETDLDKSERSVARALLALTNARDLSFSLLRMVDISVSLPFSFLGLLATYLIILLQFDKVSNPSHLSFSDNATISKVSSSTLTHN